MPTRDYSRLLPRRDKRPKHSLFWRPVETVIMHRREVLLWYFKAEAEAKKMGVDFSKVCIVLFEVHQVVRAYKMDLKRCDQTLAVSNTLCRHGA